ncbi:MAG: hypothetical protein RL625_1444 [Gemmatimonadota bacterium]
MRRLLLGVLAVGLLACDAPTKSDDPEILSIVAATTVNPMARIVTVTLAEPGRARLTWGAPGTPVLTLLGDSLSPKHRFLVTRLRANTSYTLEAQVENSSAAPVRTPLEIGALPPNLAAATFTTTGTPTEPVAVIEITSATGLAGLLMVEEGKIVGHLPISSGSLFGATRRANGQFVLLDPLHGLVVQNAAGEEITRLPLPSASVPTPYGRIHHDVIATPRNTILFIANETQLVGTDSIVGEALWEWTPESNAIVKRWSSFTELDWNTLKGSRSTPGNWLHGNGINYGPRGNVVMSLRNADHVISIAPDWSRIEWRLGGPTGTLTLPEADRSWGQHYVSEPTAGRILVFDNGYDRPGAKFSRAIEYAVDPVARTATKVWEYRPAPDIYASLVGSARRLSSGNTVVLFGMLAGQTESTGPIVAHEVSPNTGAVVWTLAAGGTLNRLYRLTPMRTIAGEVPGTFRGAR